MTQKPTDAVDFGYIEHDITFTRLAAMCLQGYLASGRKMTVEDGREISIEEASIIRATNLMKLLNKESK